jgi:hypothetical protein
MESKSNFSHLGVKPETYKEIVALRDARFPNEKLYGFIARLVDAYKKTFCPECGAELKTKICTCKKSELL